MCLYIEIHVSLSNTNEISLQGTKQPLFNHVTEMFHGFEHVHSTMAVPLITHSKSVSNVGRKFYIHKTFYACVHMFTMVISPFFNYFPVHFPENVILVHVHNSIYFIPIKVFKHCPDAVSQIRLKNNKQNIKARNISKTTAVAVSMYYCINRKQLQWQSQCIIASTENNCSCSLNLLLLWKTKRTWQKLTEYFKWMKKSSWLNKECNPKMQVTMLL